MESYAIYLESITSREFADHIRMRSFFAIRLLAIDHLGICVVAGVHVGGVHGVVDVAHELELVSGGSEAGLVERAVLYGVRGTRGLQRRRSGGGGRVMGGGGGGGRVGGGGDGRGIASEIIGVEARFCWTRSLYYNLKEILSLNTKSVKRGSSVKREAVYCIKYKGEVIKCQ